MFSYEFLKIFSSRGLRPLQALVPLLAARRAQRVNDEAVKILNLLFFVYFIWKWGETLEKLPFFTFGPKQCFDLTHSAREYFEKLTLKKSKKRNFKRLYLKSSGEFRVETKIFRTSIQFSSKEGCFLHALPTWVHGRRLHPLQPPVPLPAARRAQRVNAGLKTSPYVCVQKYYPENFAFLILRILELFSRKVCIFPINIFKVLCCFCMLCL